MTAADLLADPALAPVLAALPNARLVGGPVRDMLAGLPVADMDLATPEPPEITLAALQRAGLRVVPTGIAHGTVTAISGGRPFEITTLRHDVATDGRHATVAWTDDWQQDAARRDFTINAMSLDQAGHVHDYFGGQADLAAGRVRFVGDAAARVAEDYLRILRFFRFWARFGNGAPDRQAVAAIAEGVGGIKILSVERVWQELKRILAAPNPTETVRLMASLGVLHAVLPEGADPERLAALISAGAPPDPLLRLAALLTGEEASVAARLKFSVLEQTRLATLRHGPTPLPGDTNDALRRLLAEEDSGTLVDRTWLAGGGGPDWNDVRARLAAMPRPVFPLEGRDALALGAAPGPAVGVALREVRDWWLAQGCTADRTACMNRLRAALSGT
jgi:poly(A) polymerase